MTSSDTKRLSCNDHVRCDHALIRLLAGIGEVFAHRMHELEGFSLNADLAAGVQSSPWRSLDQMTRIARLEEVQNLAARILGLAGTELGMPLSVPSVPPAGGSAGGRGEERQ